jgi:hypothetical protein
VNRDTMSFATKLSYIKYKDGKEKEIMKVPEDQPSKWSLPGKMFVGRKENEIPRVYPREFIPLDGFFDAMITVYDHGKVDTEYMSETFDTIKARVEDQWKQSSTTGHENQTGISYEMAYKQVMTAAGIHKWDNVKTVEMLKIELGRYQLTIKQKQSINQKLALQCTPIIILYEPNGNFAMGHLHVDDFHVKNLDPVLLMEKPLHRLKPFNPVPSSNPLEAEIQNNMHATLYQLDRLLDSAVLRL